jgi:hypothetical protein
MANMVMNEKAKPRQLERILQALGEDRNAIGLIAVLATPRAGELLAISGMAAQFVGNTVQH